LPVPSVMQSKAPGKLGGEEVKPQNSKPAVMVKMPSEGAAGGAGGGGEAGTAPPEQTQMSLLVHGPVLLPPWLNLRLPPSK
jgi:hypothetical protein